MASTFQKSDVERVLKTRAGIPVKGYHILYTSGKAMTVSDLECIDWENLQRITVEFVGRFLRYSVEAHEYINANKVRVFPRDVRERRKSDLLTSAKHS